jgi:hypothetical protein
MAHMTQTKPDNSPTCPDLSGRCYFGQTTQTDKTGHYEMSCPVGVSRGTPKPVPWSAIYIRLKWMVTTPSGTAEGNRRMAASHSKPFAWTGHHRGPGRSRRMSDRNNPVSPGAVINLLTRPRRAPSMTRR